MLPNPEAWNHILTLFKFVVYITNSLTLYHYINAISGKSIGGQFM